MEKAKLISCFEELYGQNGKEIRTFFSPGRVNIIGEHQDYNGGHVFPAALELGIYAAVRVRDDRMVRFVSETRKHPITISLDDKLAYNRKQYWTNYPIGIMDQLQQEGYTLPGMDLYFWGDLPAGAGLSSSACILDLMGYICYSLLGVEVDRTHLAQIAQQAEYHFVGVKVGIMDQFAISQGRAGHGVLLNCTTMEFRLVPLTWGNYSIVIMNTNKERDLLSSDFNTRIAECEAALKELREVRPTLEGLSLATLEEVEAIADEVLRKRARHAVSENLRVLAFEEALHHNDVHQIAELINASHTSLDKDFEVTIFELNTIVEIARKQEGCIAARMIGAGFGGCAIAFVENTHVEAFKESVSKEYYEATNHQATMYDATIGDGVKEI